jgi:ubiquinone/menaquinone biosynthesis C-methylase UbiE
MNAELASPDRSIDQRKTAATTARYARIAPFYDLMGLLPEMRYRSWRTRFWVRVADKLFPGDRLLEVGVGTGKNIPYWPEQAEVSSIDLAPGMLRRAEKRSAEIGRHAQFSLQDVQQMTFPDDHFQVAAMTFVLCSVPDPMLGLAELSRVVRPGGYVFMMEHVRSPIGWIGALMDLFNPLVRGLMGPNINRDTVEKVRRSGLLLREINDLSAGGIFKIIEAQVA